MFTILRFALIEKPQASAKIKTMLLGYDDAIYLEMVEQATYSIIETVDETIPSLKMAIRTLPVRNHRQG
jgi:hypothetical protein